jgi:hypothetical protein
MMPAPKGNILAFVHIEKAAGTTLNHILRSNFLFKHVDVRPLSRSSQQAFRPDDLRKVIQINPYLKCIAGHSLCPAQPLNQFGWRLNYITLMRDPIKRYLSQFLYWRHKLNYNITFEYFLTRQHSFNLQTKKIAGTANLDKAKAIIDKQFFLVGTVEKFDEFLVMLKKKLNGFRFEPGYQRQNTARRSSKRANRLDLIKDKYRSEILERNRIDLELYNYVQSYIIPQQIDAYGPGMENDLIAFQHTLKGFRWGPSRYIDYLYRKLFIEPITGILRVKNGLPYNGSY